jgi:hypothetical protein
MTEPVEVAAADELVQLAHDVTAAQTRNNASLDALAAQGVRVDPGMILTTRITILMDTLLGPADGPDVTEARLRYEQRCQATFREMIGNIQSQIRQAQLLQGVPNAHRMRP